MRIRVQNLAVSQPFRKAMHYLHTKIIINLYNRLNFSMHVGYCVLQLQGIIEYYKGPF